MKYLPLFSSAFSIVLLHNFLSIEAYLNIATKYRQSSTQMQAIIPGKSFHCIEMYGKVFLRSFLFCVIYICLLFVMTISVGPFCPFRSSLSIETPQIESLSSVAPEITSELERLQQDMALGRNPDLKHLRQVAISIENAVDQWDNLLTGLDLSQDFQTLEYATLIQAHLSRHGQTVEEITKMMRWQSSCLMNMSKNSPPPIPPRELDVMKLMVEANESESSGKNPPSMTAIATAEKITTAPFLGNEAVFDSEIVRKEYDELCKDHNALIGTGGSYASLDSIAKLSFLDEIEIIEDRWNALFERYNLLGQVNQKFVKQCNKYLDAMGLNEQDVQELLKETHIAMREEAE